MDAKEFIIERHGQPQNDLEAEQFTEMAEMMEEYAEMKCKEQKEICLERAGPFLDAQLRIKYAPLATD